MKGMTGYGYAESHDAAYDISVEIKSWNNKYADINMVLPPVLSGLDERLRSLIRERVLRGRIDVTVRFRERQVAGTWSVDHQALEAAISCLEQIRERTGETGPIPTSILLGMEGIIRQDTDRDLEAMHQAIEPIFRQALEQLDAHRQREGLATQADLAMQLAIICRAREQVLTLAQGLETTFSENLQRRFNEVLGNAVDEHRVLQEVAVMLVRYSIHEEIERLGTHCQALTELIHKGEGVAKRIDFISQEMNREVNTIGSKSVDGTVSALVVDMKEAIDVIREQVRNIE
jgi:uncharacterized protein (TIGR00255 family)